MANEQIRTVDALRMARDRTTTSQELAKLAGHRSVDVRMAVAEHPNTSEETCDLLYGDPVWAVSKAIEQRRTKGPGIQELFPRAVVEKEAVTVGAYGPSAWLWLVTAVVVGVIVGAYVLYWAGYWTLVVFGSSG